MKHGSLFTGIGGFDLAAEWMGWSNIFHCEKNTKKLNILKKRFKNAKSHEDIVRTDFTVYRGSIDVLTGGFPCKDVSVASSNGRLGLEGQQTGLWYENLRAIHEIQPAWAVCENVYGLLTQAGGMAIDKVCTGLESEGFEVFPPLVIPALAVGANHYRKRVWIVAYSASNRKRLQKKQVQTRRDIVEHIPGWDSEPGICRVYDGLPQGLDRDRSCFLGDAIVPQIALQIFKAIETYEQLKTAI